MNERRPQGFSLVEVCMALGIVSFAIIAVLGMLTVGINTNKNSLENTAISIMSRQVVGSLRAQTFSDLPNIASVTTSSQTQLLEAYFDASGMRLQDTSTTPPADLSRTAALTKGALYKCTVSAKGDTQTTGLSLNSSTLPALVALTITFSWPAQLTTPPNSAVVHASLSNGD
jgi:uncharacterized protein (TIGR02598 family)